MSWFIARYRPTALFSLKSSRATSTVGRSLPIPTQYAVKMALIDAGLRVGRVSNPESLVRALAATEVRIGVPEDACITGTIQKIRQEPKNPSPETPYIANIALREVVFIRGVLQAAFHREACPPEVRELAPLVNHFGKRGGFVQYEGALDADELDESFTIEPVQHGPIPPAFHLSTLDDFGPGARWEALNSFSPAPMKRDRDRIWREVLIPLGLYNVGAGFAHYRR
ncbi:MAG: hypothetical protein JSU00_09625 [Acidobacteria bacterium]|nr:hypothetical protein [Acidobacteriota bacterium]